jgi:hypothetical protein
MRKLGGAVGADLLREVGRQIDAEYSELWLSEDDGLERDNIWNARQSEQAILRRLYQAIREQEKEKSDE